MKSEEIHYLVWLPAVDGQEGLYSVTHCFDLEEVLHAVSGAGTTFNRAIVTNAPLEISLAVKGRQLYPDSVSPPRWQYPVTGRAGIHVEDLGIPGGGGSSG